MKFFLRHIGNFAFTLLSLPVPILEEKYFLLSLMFLMVSTPSRRGSKILELSVPLAATVRELLQHKVLLIFVFSFL